MSIKIILKEESWTTAHGLRAVKVETILLYTSIKEELEFYHILCVAGCKVLRDIC